MKKALLFFCISFLMSCSSECIRCTRIVDGSGFEACENDEVNYTDANGREISYDQIKSAWEPEGYICE